MIDLDELERLAKEATPGPWNSKYIGTAYPLDRYVYKPESLREPGKSMVVARCEAYLETADPPYRDAPDAHFIAAANPAAILELVRIVKERDTDKFFADAPDPRDEQIAGLQAENAELTQAKRNLSSLLDRALEQNETLKAENAELRRDAERLNFADDFCDYDGLGLYIKGKTYACNSLREGLDKAMEDAARQQKG